jgi:hypothetical protein
VSVQPAAHEPTSTVVKCYGLLAPSGLYGEGWGSDAEAELDRMTAFWNRLVDIDEEARRDYRALVRSEETEAASERIAALMEEKARRVAERIARRKADRKASVTDLAVAITDLNTRLGTEIAVAKDLRNSMKLQLQAPLAELEARRRAAVRAAEHASGVWWGNRNAVLEAYQEARNAALRQAAAGENLPTLHHRNRPRRHRIVNQIQKGMSVEQLFLGLHAQIRIDPQPPGRRHHLFTATVFTMHGSAGMKRREVTWPIVLHRPPPAHAEITGAVVTRESTAGRWRWQVGLRFRIPRYTAPVGSRAAGVDIGWRLTDYGLRIAVIAESSGLTQEIVLPDAINTALAAYDDYKSARAQARHELLLRLAMVDWERAPQPLGALGREAIGKRDDKGVLCVSYTELHRLAAHWMEHPRFSPDAAAEVAEWYAEERTGATAPHRHFSAYRRALLARQDFYRCEARKIVDRIDRIGLENVDWAKAASSAVAKLPAKARRLRQRAAPQEFVTALRSAMRSSGKEDYIHWHDGPSSFLCADCGARTAPNPAQQYFSCGCGKVHDQDTNAARVLCAAAASAVMATKVPAPLAWQKRLESKMLRRRAQEDAATKHVNGGTARDGEDLPINQMDVSSEL